MSGATDLVTAPALVLYMGLTAGLDVVNSAHNLAGAEQQALPAAEAEHLLAFLERMFQHYARQPRPVENSQVLVG
eukprot:2562181-Pleurochrysis_carterae.AAC.1